MMGRLIWANLVTYSLQIGLLVGLAGFVPSLLRLRFARARLVYWQILLAVCLVLPLMRPWQRVVISAPAVQSVTPAVIAVSSTPASRPTLPRSELALLAIAAGALIRLGWLAVGFRRLRRYRQNAELWDRSPAWPAACLLSQEVASPVTFGWRKPVVLLPARFLDLDPRIQEAILCHEFLHVERRDWLFTVAEELLRALFWFHPAIWWVLGEIQLAREQAVDCQAIERTAARDEYVDALLRVAGVNSGIDLAPAPLFLRRRHFKQRVVSIFQENPMTKTRWISRLAAGLALMGAACWMVTGTFRLSAAPQVVNDAAGVTVDLGGAALLHRAPVNYPESAARKGVQGTVTVEATLDGDGNVRDARVLSGPEELRKASLQSVLQWHFAGGTAGATRIVNIAFQAPPASRLDNVVDSLQGELSRKLAAAPATAKPTSTTGEPLTLDRIVIAGLSDEMRTQLLASLPFHEGDPVPVDFHMRAVAAVKGFDEHLSVNTRFAGGRATLTITAPGTAGPAVGGSANGPKLVSQVAPAYPPDAKAQGISGAVVLRALIGADGSVRNLEVVSGPPVLAMAAIEAVQQWTYQPTLLNGNPVETKTEITVNFTLAK